MLENVFGQLSDVPNVRYKLVFSENPEAMLDSACAIKRNSHVYALYESKDQTTNYKTRLIPEVETLFNVIAVVDEK